MGKIDKFEHDYVISNAIYLAAKAHDGHRRKASDIPYIVHPFEVALILQKNGASNEVIAAGILHDTLEDTNLTEDDIKNIFGEKILNLVLGASEELNNRKNRTWEERKKHTIEYSKKASFDVKLIICADKLSNIRSMIKDYEEIGDKLWEKFNAPYHKQKWYYKSLVESLHELEGYEMYEEFKRAVKELFD